MNTDQTAKKYILTKNKQQQFIPQLLLSFKLERELIFDASKFVTLLSLNHLNSNTFIQDGFLELITQNLCLFNEYNDEILSILENIEVHTLKLSANTQIQNQKYKNLCILINIILDSPVANKIKNQIISQKLQFALENEIPIPEVMYALKVINDKIQYAYHDKLLMGLYNSLKQIQTPKYVPKQIDQLIVQSIILLSQNYIQLEDIIEVIINDQESIFNQNLKSIDTSNTISFLLQSGLQLLEEQLKLKTKSQTLIDSYHPRTEEIDHDLEMACKVLLAAAVEKKVLLIKLLSSIKIENNEILLYNCSKLIKFLNKVPQLQTSISQFGSNYSIIGSEFNKFKQIPLSAIVLNILLLIQTNCTKYRGQIEYHLQKAQFRFFYQNILLSNNPNFQGITNAIRDIMEFIIITSKTLKSKYFLTQYEQIRQGVMQILQFYCENQIIFIEILRFITPELKLNNLELLIKQLDVHPGMWEFSSAISFSTQNCTKSQLLTAQKYCLVNFVYINIQDISNQSEQGIIFRMVSLICNQVEENNAQLKQILKEDGILENLLMIDQKYSKQFYQKIRILGNM